MYMYVYFYIHIRGGRYDQNLISRYDKFYITVTQYISRYSDLFLFFFKNISLFSKSSSFSLSFSPSLASLYLFEQCLRLGVIATSSVCLPLQD